MELESLPSFEGAGAPSTDDSKQKKVKLGSKARRLLKLQKQQGQKGAKYATMVLCFFPIASENLHVEIAATLDSCDDCKYCIEYRELIRVYCYVQGSTRNRNT